LNKGAKTLNNILVHFTHKDFSRIMDNLTASVVSWSEFLATDPEVRVRFPAIPDFLRGSGSGTGPTQPLEYTLRSYLEEKVAAPVYKT
jgi:hypothetical protein